MDITIDNPQVTVNQICWMAGIWDGEGSFSIVRQNTKNTNKPFGLNPKITMENTSAEMIDECCKILDGSEISFYITERKIRSNRHKQAYVLQVCRIDMILKFCDLLLPHLITKKAQASLLRRYAKSRIGQYAGRGKRVPFTEEEVGLCEKVQELNRLGPTGTSTTLRKNLTDQLSKQRRWTDKRDDKIKSGLNGDIQKQAEMTYSLI